MKKRKLFKFIICLLTAVTGLCAVFGSAACSSAGTYGDTFTGSLSKNVYRSVYSAVSGFVNDELNGKTEYVLRNYEVGKKISPEESVIQDVSTDSEIYPVTVKYSKKGSDIEKTVSAYVLQNQEGYRYFAPLPKTGEPLTNSYYNSVLSNPAYNNCTVVTTYSGQIFSINSIYYQIFMFDGGKAYFKQTLPAMQVDFYMTEAENGFAYYSKPPFAGESEYLTNEELNDWIQKNYGSDYYFEGYYLKKGGKSYSLDSFKSVSELSTFIYAANFDSTFFEKTDYGFHMSGDKFKEAIYALAGEMGEDDYELHLQIDEHVKNIDIKYYVYEGRLSKIDFVLQGIIGDDPKDILSIEMHTTFKDFGTTNIDLPR